VVGEVPSFNLGGVVRIDVIAMEAPSDNLAGSVIEFYIPSRFQRKVAWVPPQKRGKVIEFCTQVKKSA
jgi:hypothetical protein